MTNQRTGFLTVDEQGRIILPRELAERLAITPGSLLPFRLDDANLTLSRPIDLLERVYIEPTNQCNFQCVTCMRHAWGETAGQMTAATFEAILSSLRGFASLPLVFFGGYGEPLVHPEIVNMVAAVHQLGARVELITNGSLLDETTARRLIDAGLDRLWVSIDGVSPASFADIRVGESLPQVIENLESLLRIRAEACSVTPRLGIAFVAMQRNNHELPGVMRLGRRLGADRFSISNVLAHTPDLQGETLYSRSFYETNQMPSEWSPLLQLPRLEINPATAQPLMEALKGRLNLNIAGQDLHLGANICPFVEKRSLSIRWDGEVSPCLPLLHTHQSFLDSTHRTNHAVSFGNVRSQPLSDLWASPDFHDLRLRLADFDFSPCVYCNSCEFSESNCEDCFGNTAPACGGCLWAQGFIRCP